MGFGFQVLDSGFSCILDLIVSGIPDSLGYIRDSTSQNFPDSGIWIPLHRAIPVLKDTLIEYL